MGSMAEPLPNIPAGSTIRQNPDGSWQYQRRSVGPWLPMPAPQSWLPWQTPPNLRAPMCKPSQGYYESSNTLRPTTQAAWDAYNDVLERVGVFEDHGDALAAFLRVIAKTVIPDEEYCDPYEHETIREDLLRIASELERNHNNNNQ